MAFRFIATVFNFYIDILRIFYDYYRKDTAVKFNYTLKDDEGNILDQSPEGQPLAYLHGHSNIIPGLESQLEGKSAGEKSTQWLSLLMAMASIKSSGTARTTRKLPRR